MCLAGLIPFAAAYVELFFIMTSLWMDQFYYVFGFTLAVYIILLITCAEITVLLTYYQLCAENHRWWWFSFLTAGGNALYTYCYSLFWFRSLEASKMLITYMLYFGYMFLICTAIFLVTGSVGMLTSFWFIRKIFGSIKVD
jgi:transmembrane 9 superfamily protein 2/4